jgi:hypothetical protein
MKRVVTSGRNAHSRYTAAQIEVIERELKAIEDAEDGIRPARVLALAREESHPLHTMLTWDDRDAAEKYRLDEVRRMCRAVQVRVVDESGEETHHAPMFVSISEESDADGDAAHSERVYRRFERAIKDPVSRQALIDEALRQIAYWQERHKALEELTPVFAAIEKAAKKVRRRKAS